MSEESTVREEAAVAELPAPWGAGITVFMTLALVLALVAAQSTIAAFLQRNGLILGLGITLSLPTVLVLTWMFIRLCGGPTVKEYLALKGIPRRQVLVCAGVIVMFTGIYDIVTLSLGRPLVPDVMVDVYRTATIAPLLWFALIVGAPVIEETIFRGFLWAGLEGTWLGHTGTILVCSAAWAGMHRQYDLYGMVSVFLLGLVLGLARSITGSLPACYGMHALVNLIATLETAWLAAG